MLTRENWENNICYTDGIGGIDDNMTIGVWKILRSSWKLVIKTYKITQEHAICH